MHWLYGMSGFGADRLFRVPIGAAILLSLGLIGAAILLSLGLIAGCDRGPAASNASPRAVAKAYVVAMNSGDAQTLAAVSHGDEDSLKLLTSVAKANAGYARLEKLAGEKFGDPNAVFAYPRATDHYGQMQKSIDSAEEQVSGASAIVGKGMGSVHLLQVGNGWKVDRSKHVQPGDVSASALTMSDALARAYNEVADRLAAGGYESANDAKADLLGRTQQAVLAQMATPATEPATPPVTAPASPATQPVPDE